MIIVTKKIRDKKCWWARKNW